VPFPQESRSLAQRARVLAPFLCLLTGCATFRPLPPPTPEVPLADWERAGSGADTRDRLRTGERRAPAPALAKSASHREGDGPYAPPATTSPSPIPGSAACLSELRSLDVDFRESAPVVGITTPVVHAGRLDGIRFYASDHRSQLADSRLVHALPLITPDLRALGVSEVRFSGAYVYKLTHPGRMSMHAYGLAADLHAFRVAGTLLEVKHDFARGVGCSGGLPVLNQIACRIRARRLFKEQLGPDDNAAHFDHFHVGLKPLPGELAPNLPLPVAVTPRHRAARVTAPKRSVKKRSAR
jgi:hypothetical protein